jgi:hypothetical protein
VRRIPLPSRPRSSLLLGACLSASLPARAGNDDEIFVGNHAAMTGGAVSATVSDSSATWYNPAGLGAVGLDQIDVSATCYALRAYSAPRFIASQTGEAESASLVEFVSVPSQVALVRRLGPGMSLGLGYFVPQAANLLLRESLQLDQEGLQSAWQVSLNQVRVQHTAAAGLGMQLSSGVRLGVSLVGTYQAETQSVSIVAAQGQDERAGTARQRFLSTNLLGTSTRIGMELGAGFQIDVTPRWRLALSARSARVLIYQALRVSGATVEADVRGADGAPGVIQAEIADPSEQHPSFDVVRAGRLNLALAYLGSDGDWLALEADVQPPIVDANTGVDRRTVFNARLGMYHRVTETLAFGAGLFTDRTADPKPIDPISAAGDFYGGSLGVEYSNRHRLQAERADALSLSTTLALRYAYSRSLLNDVLVDPGDVSSLGALPGRLYVHELGLYIGGGLAF